MSDESQEQDENTKPTSTDLDTQAQSDEYTPEPQQNGRAATSPFDDLDPDSAMSPEREKGDAVMAKFGSLFPNPGPVPATILPQGSYSEIIDRLLEVLYEERVCLIYGEAYAADFAYAMLQRMVDQNDEIDQSEVCRLVLYDNYLLSRSSHEFLILLKEHLHGDLLVLHLPLKKSSYFCEPLFRPDVYQAMLDTLRSDDCNSALLIIIDQEQEERPDYIAKYLTGSHTQAVPWVDILVNQWKDSVGLDNEEYERIHQHLRSVVSANPRKVARWALGLTRLRPSSVSDFDGHDRTAWFIDSINAATRYGERIVADKLSNLMAPGWRQPLRSVLLSFYSLLCVDGPVHYQTLLRLGSQYLRGSPLRMPVAMEETVVGDEAGMGLLGNGSGSCSITRVNHYQDMKAEQIWEQQFDALIWECGLETDQTEKGISIKENYEVWRSSLLPIQVYRRFPGSVRRVLEDIIQNQYLFPSSVESIHDAQDYARLLVAVYQRDSSLMPLDHLVDMMLRSGAMKVSSQLNNNLRQTEKDAIWDLAAIGIAFLFLAIERLNISVQEKKEVYNKATDRSLENYKRARLLVGAFDMLTQREDFSPYSYLFKILTHKWRDRDNDRADLWKAVRIGYVQRMRKSLEFRCEILYKLREEFSREDQYNDAHTIMESRLWYDAVFSDFSRSNRTLEQSFARVVKDGVRDDVTKLVGTYVSIDPSNAVLGNIDINRVIRDLAATLVHDLEFGEVAPASLSPKIFHQAMLSEVIATQQDNINQAREMARGKPEFDEYFERLINESDPLVRFYLARKIQETEQGRHFMAQCLYDYTRYRNIVLAEWASMAAGYPVGDDNPAGQDIIERYLIILLECLDETTLESVCLDWQIASVWLRSVAGQLEIPSGVALDIRNQYREIKQRLLDKSQRFKGMRSWLKNTIKQRSSQELSV